MSKVEMLKPSPCIYCANVCSSDTLRHCHMLLFHTHEYVFSDVYNAFISARDGKPCQAAENGDNGPPRLDAFIAAFDLKFGKGDVVSSARSSDLLTPDKSPQLSVETRLDDAQCVDFADTARQTSKSDAHQTKEVAMVSVESTSLMPNIALDRQSTVLWTPSPSPNDAPVACDRLRDADRTPPPPLNLSLSPCTIEQVAGVNDPCQSPKVAERVEQSVKCDVVEREQPLDGPGVQSTDALHTPKIAANVPTRLLAVGPGAAQMTAAETSEDVPVAVKNEVEVPLEKIIKREPEECHQSGIPLRKEAMGELTVIDLTESEEDDVGEFEMTDELIDMDLETDTEDEIVCVSDSLGSENKPPPPQDNKATDRGAEPASALPALPPIDHMKHTEIVFSSKSIDEYKRMVVMKNEEPVEPPKPAGGKARSVFSRLADRSFNCSIESGGGKAPSVLSRLGDRTLNCSIEGGGGKRSKPYDRVRKLVKKSIMNCGGNQRTPVKRGGEVCRHTNVYPLGDLPTPQEQPLRVYETNQTDDLLRCNTCKSTKVVRECGLAVLQVARFDEAPRFLLKSNNSGREQRTFRILVYVRTRDT
uniref:C2H2-type domain-containing protein n=1 Tax=Plectus sambesii TaxID=2011161 RepID=A0A914VW81_9BILA